MKTSCLLYTGAFFGPVLAFPKASFSHESGSAESIIKQIRHARAEVRDGEQHSEKRQGLLGSLLGTVGSLVGSVASAIDTSNQRPEPGYVFQAPGPSDSRGPCPGLNLLANYGYLPRDGYVSLDQVIEATARGFNMGVDLATILGVFAVLTDGNITTESFYLGAPPNGVGGLNRHSTVETDISPNREDFYNACVGLSSHFRLPSRDLGSCVHRFRGTSSLGYYPVLKMQSRPPLTCQIYRATTTTCLADVSSKMSNLLPRPRASSST